MPHIIVEYSQDIAERHDVSTLCRSLYQAALDSGVFTDPASIKTRAHGCDHLHLGSGGSSFTHIDLRLLSGRTEAQKKSATTSLLNAAVALLDDVPEISVDCIDLSAAYTKR